MANLSASSETPSTHRPPPTRHGKHEVGAIFVDKFGLPSPPLEGCTGATSSLCSPDSVLPPPSSFQQVCGERARPASYAGGQEGAEDEAEGGESKARLGKLSKKHVQELESIFRANPAGAPDKRAGLARQFGVAQQQIATWFQNRRARQRKKQLQQDFELLKKCLRAAFLENQALRRELDELREVHALCPPPALPRQPAAPAPAPLAALPALPAPDALPALLVASRPPSPLSPALEKRPLRTLSAPSFAKRARIPAAQPEAAFAAALPLMHTDTSALTPPAPHAAGASLEGPIAALHATPAHAAPPPSLSSEAADEKMTLDEAFRELLTNDPLEAPLGNRGLEGSMGLGLSGGDPLGALADSLDNGEGGGGMERPGPFAEEWGSMEWEGEADSCLDTLLGMHQLDPTLDLETASQAFTREDLKAQPGWWMR